MRPKVKARYDVAIVGAGFTGLVAAYELSKRGLKVKVLEADIEAGGLAGTFEFSDGIRIEKFYHHWFNSDKYIFELINELGFESDIVINPSRNGMYFNKRHWKLTSPLDLLKFTPLSLIERIRLGLLVFQVRLIKDWKKIENLSVREWLEPIVGKNVYRVVWDPLIQSKFSIYAEDINAVWLWKKLVLRGSTRDKAGREELAYFKGGFGRLAELMVEKIKSLGGEVDFSTRVENVLTSGKSITELQTNNGSVLASSYLFTPSFHIISKIFSQTTEREWLESLERVQYLGNMCLALRLNKSLSGTYWLNVNDPGFPFVGVIEHTNFDPPKNYNGSHIVYLSKYLATSDAIWSFSEKEYADFAIEHLKKMFPKFDKNNVIEYRMWREPYAQPVTERNYSKYVPGSITPFENGFISTMAQVYPEDRGTNYAVREAKKIVEDILIKKDQN